MISFYPSKPKTKTQYCYLREHEPYELRDAINNLSAEWIVVAIYYDSDDGYHVAWCKREL